MSSLEFPFTIDIMVRLWFAVLTTIMLGYLYYKLRYNGFAALLGASVFNIVVKVMIIKGFVFFGDTTHGNLVAFQDFGYCIAAAILLWDFARTDWRIKKS